MDSTDSVSTTPQLPRERVHVDLGAGTITREPIPDRWCHRYLGGKGLAARHLYELVGPEIDPLAPENALVFALGPLSGVLPGEPRFAAVTKSPLTGLFLDSYCGGTFAGRLPGALEALLLVVTGRATEPTTIVLDHGDIRLESATDVWGADTLATDDAYPDAAVACIGPAGEHEVRYATIAADGGDHHAGRGGAGAVMGSKRLKAVVARGPSSERRLETASTAIEQLFEQTQTRFDNSETGRWLGVSGTMETVDAAAATGVLPTRGWSEDGTADGDGIGIEAVRALSREREGPAEGDFVFEGDSGDVVPRGGTPIALGAGLGIDDFERVLELAEVCDRLGLDVIAAGNAVAWAIRATDQQHLELEDDRHQPLTFGDGDAARRLIEAIATRESPLGDALADGVSTAAERLGARALAPTVKGMTLASYDPRGSPAMALAFATSDRGACHRRARPIFEEVIGGEAWTTAERASLVRLEQDTRAVLWSLVVDDFVGEVLTPALIESWLEAVGFETPDRLETIGERIWTLTRLYNVREGIRRPDDDLPAVLSVGRDRAVAETAPNSSSGVTATESTPVAFEHLVQTYYAIREWGSDGVPSRALLERLSLLEALDEQTPVAEKAASSGDE